MLHGLSKAARNERTKLRAASMNAIGLGFGAVGAIQPIIVGDVSSLAVIKILVSGLIAYILHLQAVRYLATLED
ncbi:MAG TPA: hypothetical protein VG735_16490 [Caulobacterales bacterium]|jgi:hypothetical protein|nr:hypothetical protein [Caulobacterales bacterium]